MLLYLAANLAYSLLGFKDIPIVDVTIVALGFVLRVMYGGLLAGVEVSNWLLLTVMMASYYMALGKRRNELRDTREQTRAVLTRYTYDFLDRQMYLFLTLTVAFYSLWSVDAHTAPQRTEKPSGESKSSRSRRRKRGGANAEKRADKPERTERTERAERAEKKPERGEKKPAGENRSARRGAEKPPVNAAPAGDKAERTDKTRRRSRRRKPRPKTEGEAPKA